ncbi:hypothetical protein Tco_0453560 [Tanacetum coccineum]
MEVPPCDCKKERKSNICFTRYLSLVLEHPLGDAYINENLKTFKPYHITASSFKPTFENKVPLTAHMCKVAKLLPEPIKSLIQPSRDVITNDIAASSDPKTSKFVRESTSTPQVADTQQTKETVVTANATQSLEASESAQDQGNQPQTIDAKTADHVMEEEDHDKGINSSIVSMGDVRLEDLSVNDEDNPFDTESEIKVLVEEPTDFDLHSMPDDEVESISGFEAADSNEEGTENTADNILDKIADLKASADNTSDPLGHLQTDISSLSNKVENLESSLAKTVSSKLEESVPRMVADAFEERMPELISETLKNIIPNIIEESIQQALPKFDQRIQETLQSTMPELIRKLLNKELNALNTLEIQRFASLQKELLTAIRAKVGKSVRKTLWKEIDIMKDRLSYYDDKLDKGDVNLRELIILMKGMGENLPKNDEMVNAQLQILDPAQGEQQLNDDEMASVQDEQPSM